MGTPYQEQQKNSALMNQWEQIAHDYETHRPRLDDETRLIGDKIVKRIKQKDCLYPQHLARMLGSIISTERSFGTYVGDKR